MHETPGTLSRRRFINLVGKAGGYAAAYHTMAAMGLLASPGHAAPPVLAPGSGRGLRVVIVGGGLAGMTAAYELNKAGYQCTILEARSRAGGRCWTIRGGDRVEETDSTQTAEWGRGESLYFNVGPARLPHTHKAILGYCREFGIPLEVIVNENRNALMHDAASFDGKPVRMRQVRGDMQGQLAELLAKAVDKGALDDAIDPADKEKLLDLVRKFGGLKDGAYRGSSRAGYRVPPGAGLDVGQLNETLALKTLMAKPFWVETAAFAEIYYEQGATMLQPVGGMDRIAVAFARRVARMIRTNAVVTQIRRVGEAARVIYKDSRTGAETALDAPFVLVTLPLSVLKGIDTDFSPAHKTAIAAGEYVPAAKIAFEARRRFWEQDDQIYGGISWTTQDITQIWYPSNGFHSRTGILMGGYIWSDDIGEAFAKLPPAQRLERAVAQGEKLHPSYRADMHRGVAVCWGKVPYSNGAWCEWSEDAKRDAYPVLVKPDGPLFLAGEHLSNLPGWQEGAILSAYKAMEAIAERAANRKA